MAVTVPGVPAVVAVAARISASWWNTAVRPVLAWLQRDAPVVYRTQGATQSVPDSTWTDITLVNVVIDNAGLVTSGVTPGVNIGDAPGVYAVSGAVVWGSSPAGTYRRASLALNGTILNGSAGQADPENLAVAQTPTVLVRAASGDVLTLQGFHDAGVSISTGLAAGQFASSLSVVFLRL